MGRNSEFNQAAADMGGVVSGSEGSQGSFFSFLGELFGGKNKKARRGADKSDLTWRDGSTRDNEDNVIFYDTAPRD